MFRPSETEFLSPKGKQVRDNIHSHDVVEFMRRFIVSPRVGEVDNLGGG
jgi:CDP-paratose 2-epimerase